MERLAPGLHTETGTINFQSARNRIPYLVRGQGFLFRGVGGAQYHGGQSTPGAWSPPPLIFLFPPWGLESWLQLPTWWNILTHVKNAFKHNNCLKKKEKDFNMKSVGHRQSWVGHFFWLPQFQGSKGGCPPKKFQILFTNSCQITIYSTLSFCYCFLLLNASTYCIKVYWLFLNI